MVDPFKNILKHKCNEWEKDILKDYFCGKELLLKAQY